MQKCPDKVDAWIGYIGLALISKNFALTEQCWFFFFTLVIVLCHFHSSYMKITDTDICLLLYLTRRLSVTEVQWVILASSYGVHSCLWTWAWRHLQRHPGTGAEASPHSGELRPDPGWRMLVTHARWGAYSLAQTGAANANHSRRAHQQPGGKLASLSKQVSF